MNPEETPSLNPRDPQHFELLRIAQDLHTARMLLEHAIPGHELGDDGIDYLQSALMLSHDMNDSDYRDDMLGMMTTTNWEDSLLYKYATDGICPAIYEALPKSIQEML